VLAGGQSLGPLLNLRLVEPAVLVDVNGIGGLAELEETDARLAIGALVRHRRLERDPLVARACPLLAEAAAQVGHVAIRNRGTFGGSLAHADPAAELPAAVATLDGEVELRSVRGSRRLRTGDFFRAPFETAVEEGELVVGVRVPRVPDRTGQVWLELNERHGHFALVGVAVSLTLAEDGTCSEARLAYAGVGPVPWVAAEAATLLPGAGPEAFKDAAVAAAEGCSPPSDAHGSSSYRRRLVRVLTQRALTEAAARAA
jgi:aerobic carbon-monoxide dehydrogenase medium subunit